MTQFHQRRREWMRPRPIEFSLMAVRLIEKKLLGVVDPTSAQRLLTTLEDPAIF
jgi:hypothetical protein